MIFQEIEKNSWNQNRAKRCDTNVLRSRAHWAEWRGLFWSRQKNSCNHGDLLLPRAIWRVFGDPGHAPHTGSNALHLYPGWARADSGFWYGGDTVQTEVKTEARDRDPNVLQLPEPTSESAQLSRPRVCLPPLYEAEWLIESIQVTYIQSWEKLVVWQCSLAYLDSCKVPCKALILGQLWVPISPS